MACQRRTICSPKFLTGLLSGIIMGFLMGSIHLAIINSPFYQPGEENPCSKEAPIFQIDTKEKRSDVAAAKRDSIPKSREKNDGNEPVYEDRTGLNNIFDFNFNNFDDVQQDPDFESLLQDSFVDKIYEVDLSKVGQGGKRETVVFREVPSPIKAIHRGNGNLIGTNSQGQGRITPGESGQFLYIGVMTAAKYVPTRGKAIMDTWARKVSGKVELFVGEEAELDGLYNEKTTLNVVRLKKVDDNAYPPQKKSFMMLKYMYDQYLNGFEWFVRADDDAYIKPDKLENLLRKLNSSEPIFIGQTGFGNEEERGKLTLKHGENYCMGGPGMIFSREVIRRMAPNIGKCLQNMYTNHEDVEVSRCVRKYANVNCVWSYEMRELFYEHYSKRLGYIDPLDSSFGNGLLDAITLHPNKKPEYQRVLHNFFLSQKIKTLQSKLSKLYREVVEADSVLDRTPEMEEFMLGSPLTLNRFRPYNGDHNQLWNFFTDRLFVTPGDMPRRGIPSHTQSAVKSLVLQVIHTMNSNAKARGRVISFQRVNYGYMRINLLFGSEYVLDLLLYYNRYRGRKVSLPVRRHAYLQQTFARTELYEDSGTDLARLIRMELSSLSGKSLAGNFIRNPVQAIAAFFGYWRANQKDLTFELQQRNSHVDRRFSTSVGAGSTLPTVNLIVPLTGRFLTFQRFMINLEKVAFTRDDPISVLIMLFMPKDADERLDMRLTQQLIKDYKARYPSYDIRYLPVAGDFSRGVALEVGASQFSGNCLLFFCDVDVILNSNFLRKCRANTVRGKTVYYPILFSEFDPNFGKIEDYMGQDRDKHFEITKDSGYWRGFGYGLLCVYQSDFVSTGGFDTSIKGWGLEDVDLFAKFLKSDTEEDTEKLTNPVTAKPMRVREPDLIHVYHQSHCDPVLEIQQLTMCRASRSSGIMSVSRLYQKWQERVDSDELGKERDVALEHLQDILQNDQSKDKFFYDRAANKR